MTKIFKIKAPENKLFLTNKRSNIFRLNDTCIKIGLKYDLFSFQRIKAGKLIALYLEPGGVIIKMSVVARFSTINTLPVVVPQPTVLLHFVQGIFNK